MNLFDLFGKTAVVTGGTRGIGLMIARGLLEAGARVYISSRKADACAAAELELQQYGTVAAIPADLSTEDECVRLAGAIGEREQTLNVLVNNAGATWGAPIEDFPAAAWDKVVDLNLKSPFFLTRAFLPLLDAGATLKTFGDAITAAAPLRRIGRPDDMAGVAIYLASRAGAYVTGAVIPVDGGLGTTV